MSQTVSADLSACHRRPVRQWARVESEKVTRSEFRASHKHTFARRRIKQGTSEMKRAADLCRKMIELSANRARTAQQTDQTMPVHKHPPSISMHPLPVSSSPLRSILGSSMRVDNTPLPESSCINAAHFITSGCSCRGDGVMAARRRQLKVSTWFRYSLLQLGRMRCGYVQSGPSHIDRLARSSITRIFL